MRQLVLGLLLAAALGGCTSAPQTEQLSRTTTPDTPRRALLGDTPFFPQTEYHCGPAALSMLLRNLGREVTPETLAPQVFIPQRRGSLQAEMLAAVRSYQLIPYPPPPKLLALFREIDAGRPILVLQNLGLDSLPRWHYAVLIGYDLDRQEVILHSGISERLTRPMGLFEQTWRRANYWAFSLLEPTTPPSGLEPERYLKAASDLERAGRTQTATQAYTSATRTWPSSPLPWMALGNSAYASNRYQDAEQAFRRALDLQPNLSAAWNNLAYSLQAQGCNEQAQAAIGCALQLAPQSSNLLASQQDLAGDTQQRAQNCQPLTCPH